MRLNKIFIVSLIILAILTVGAVSASDNVTSDDLSIGLEDADVQESSLDDDLTAISDDSDIQESSLDDDLTAISDDSDDEKVNEEIGETDDVLSKGYDDIIGVEESDANTIIGKEVTNDEPVLTSTDKEVLSSSSKNVKITILKQTGKTAKNKKFYVKITYAKTGKPVCEENINIDFKCIREDGSGSNEDWVYVSTNSKGIGAFKWSDLGWTKDNKGNIGVWTLYLSLDSAVIWSEDMDDFMWTKSNKVKTKVTFRNVKQTVVIKPKKLSTSFKSGKYFKAKVINSKTKKPVKGVKVIFKVYTNKKAKKVTLTSNSKGLIKYSSSKLKVGKHKVVLKVKKSKKFKGKTKKSSIKISKARLKVSAPKVTAKSKKSKLFKVTVKNKKSGKPVKGIKVIMKVYTGKKYKRIVHKTNKKGKTGFNTKILSRGKHKVVVVIKANSKYKKAVKKSSVVIKGKKATNKGKTQKTNGKVRTSIKCKGSVEKRSYTYQSGYYTSPRGQEPLYNTAYYPVVGITPTLKGANGKTLKGNYKATLYYYDSDGESYYSETFTGTFGQYRSYTGSNGGWQYKLKISYKGCSNYRASSYSTSLGMNVYF